MANHGGDVVDLLVIFGTNGDLARKLTFAAPYQWQQTWLSADT
jgi:glucose-6-phosphate 1-dehydrogenase